MEVLKTITNGIMFLTVCVYGMINFWVYMELCGYTARGEKAIVASLGGIEKVLYGPSIWAHNMTYKDSPVIIADQEQLYDLAFGSE